MPPQHRMVEPQTPQRPTRCRSHLPLGQGNRSRVRLGNAPAQCKGRRARWCPTRDWRAPPRATARARRRTGPRPRRSRETPALNQSSGRSASIFRVAIQHTMYFRTTYSRTPSQSSRRNPPGGILGPERLRQEAVRSSQTAFLDLRRQKTTAHERHLTNPGHVVRGNCVSHAGLAAR